MKRARPRSDPAAPGCSAPLGPSAGAWRQLPLARGPSWIVTHSLFCSLLSGAASRGPGCFCLCDWKELSRVCLAEAWIGQLLLYFSGRTTYRAASGTGGHSTVQQGCGVVLGHLPQGRVQAGPPGQNHSGSEHQGSATPKVLCDVVSYPILNQTAMSQGTFPVWPILTEAWEF